ncbi:hypothetical protein [Micromonospora cremea]|uniref:hypothetical protein n=1 Tax=Micromonospora cremea TaxID=709881 RepID=UPI000940C96E|nr:hypothetical protein [Micromonospora cremea]
MVTTDDHDNTTYSLTGDTDYTYADLADATAKVLGKPVRYQPVSAEHYQAILTGAGLDEGTAGFSPPLTATWAPGSWPTPATSPASSDTAPCPWPKQRNAQHRRQARQA